MITSARGAPGDPAGEPFSGLFSFHRAGPTVLRMVVGAQLRRLREAKGISAADAAYAIRATHSKISRMELGRVSFRQRDIADLLTMYGMHDEQERSAFLALASEANVPGWWHDSADLLPSWFEPYLGLEEAASIIRNYEVQFVPGQLQTADYARAVIRLGYPEAAEEEIDRRTALRVGRRRAVQPAPVPRARPARRRVPRAAHQRAVPGPARGRGLLPRGHGPAVPAGRASHRHRDDPQGDPRETLSGPPGLLGPVSDSPPAVRHVRRQ